MNEVEKMYRLANVAKPIIKKWYYDGYYEDFSWKSSEEDCTKLLKHFDNSIDKLNDRIQQMKKEENANYDRYTDSVMTEFGRVEKAYIDYPPFTAEKQLEVENVIFQCNFGVCELERTMPAEFTKDNKFVKHYFAWQYYAGDSGYYDETTGATYDDWDVEYSNPDRKEALAGFVNALWDEYLSEEERKQIKEILE